ncbi:MAG: hypothetical protein QF789_09520 [Gammaproteobacteria bacterium]|nr:hypothetical protein [Gammaproteobacteria bacterium]MDP7270077.1 hypothetical protein [Gammaproteobacteria bacterium]MDP7661442.1 hypothetical protein [Gammaproteobacteria bacterium]HJP04915.1 hypothetical protein [Gammaproteobacteria bacterium]
MKFVPASVVAVALCGVALPAHAYLDPSTGSMILSAVVGLVATAGLALKTYWYKLKAFFRSVQEEQPDTEDVESEPQ